MPLRRDEVEVGGKYLWQPDFDGSGDWPEDEVVTVVEPPLTATCCRAVGSPGPDTPVPAPDEYDWWVTIERQDGTREQTKVGRLSRRDALEEPELKPDEVECGTLLEYRVDPAVSEWVPAKAKGVPRHPDGGRYTGGIMPPRSDAPLVVTIELKGGKEVEATLDQLRLVKDQAS